MKTTISDNLLNDPAVQRESMKDESRSMNTAHTPGPWVMADKQLSGAFQVLPYNRFGIRVATITNAHNDEANARLIAAAPELLEALRVLADHAQETHPHFESERGQRDIAAAIAAITKAL